MLELPVIHRGPHAWPLYMVGTAGFETETPAMAPGCTIIRGTLWRRP